MKGSDRVSFGIGSVKMVGVDELEKRLVVKEFSKRVVWVWVWEFETSGLPCARMVETGESADGVRHSSPWLLDDNLVKKMVVRLIGSLS